MKCREFMEAAELLTPAQLTRMQSEEPSLSAHARGCAACGSWLESHRVLGNALGALRAATVQREASPSVEATVLQAFRREGFAAKAVAMPARSEPAISRLSRFFEIGAYVAVAAALIVGVFLGARILKDKQAQSPAVHAQATRAPQQTSTGPTAAQTESQHNDAPLVQKVAQPTLVRAAAMKPMTDSGGSEQADYVAVMLCDPLICSGDEQVVRMELPATVTTDASASQPVFADVVIGEDGLVRAMRIVHE